jgi:hypothetical protein
MSSISEIMEDVRIMKRQVAKLDGSLKWQLEFIRDAIELIGAYAEFSGAKMMYFNSAEERVHTDLLARYRDLLKRSAGRV